MFEPIQPYLNGDISDHDLLWNLQKGRCYYCDTEMEHKKFRPEVGPVNERSSTIEHLHRRADGGKNTLTNKRLACYLCNTHRGTKDWRTYRGFPDDRYEERR